MMVLATSQGLNILKATYPVQWQPCFKAHQNLWCLAWIMQLRWLSMHLSFPTLV